MEVEASVTGVCQTGQVKCYTGRVRNGLGSSH